MTTSEERKMMVAPEPSPASTEPTLNRIKSMRLQLDDYSKITANGLLFLLNPGVSGIEPVKLLDGEWLLQRAEQLRAAPSRDERRDLALPRRQDLERSSECKKAFMSVDELLSIHEGMSADPQLTKIGSPLPLVVVSHCWHDAPHPDPFGDNLLKLADAITTMRAKELDSRKRAAPEGRFAIFYDWCSLCQKDTNGDRSEGETDAFRAALARMQLLYAHQKTLVYLLTEQPDGWSGPRYEDRGWPSFERTVTMLLKHHSHESWQLIVDAADSETRPQPPKLPEEFDAMLNDMTFSSGADRELVSELYRQTLTVALGQTRTLRYAGLRWGDDEMVQLVRVLPMCHSLRTLNLKGTHNAYTPKSAELLAALLRRQPPHMRRLKCIGARCGVKGEGEATSGPLLSSAALRSACAARGITLAADVQLDVEKASRGSVVIAHVRRLAHMRIHRPARNSQAEAPSAPSRWARIRGAARIVHGRKPTASATRRRAAAGGRGWLCGCYGFRDT